MRLNSRGDILAGLNKAWLTDDVWITQAGSDAIGWKTVDSHGNTLDEQGFNTVCAGGGKWATWLDGRGPKGNFGPLDPAGIVLDIGRDGTVAWCPNYLAGLQVEGSFVLHTRVCDGHIVYTLANGRVWSTKKGYAAIPSGVVPFRAVVLGDMLLYHTHEHLVLQRFHEMAGWVVAEKPAYSPDFIEAEHGWRVVWCLNEGESATNEDTIPFMLPEADLSELRDFSIEEPTVSLQAPNQISVVRAAILAHPEIDTLDENTRGSILDHVCATLGGAPWGRKSRNKEGTDLNTDGLTYKRTDGKFEIYDVIDGTSGAATWEGFGPFAQGENGYWVPAKPVSGAPPPPPPSDTHRYDGGGNDTGTCDVCGKSRFDPVHAIPQSKVAHAYDGGEQDTGLCDICARVQGDPIHHGIIEPPPPPPPPPPTDLAAAVADLQRRMVKLESSRTGTFILEWD